MTNKWGEIISPERLRQPLIFKGMKRGKLQPTDIDAMFEFQDRAYVFFEVKHLDKDVPFGQRMALERMVKDARKVGKVAVAMVVSHSVDDPREPVDLAECIVREIYYSNSPGWWKATRPIKAGEALESFTKFAGIRW